MTNTYSIEKLIKNPSLQNTFGFFGENPNSAIWVAASVAAFKGVFRPMFTMMDKKSDPKTKKYAAIREGLTEAIAIPIYIAVPLICGKLIVDKFYKGASKVAQKAVGANVKFIAVLASTAIIPAVCNLIQPQIMNAIQSKSQDKKPNPINTDKPAFAGRRNVRTYSPQVGINHNMKVGG